MTTTLAAGSVREVFERLRGANLEFNRRHPGESERRQPVHSVYGGAHLFRSDSAARFGALALRALEEHAPTPGDLARAVGLPEELAPRIYERV
ncbi:MAG TPA: phosphoenolpyruvate kinase, partial [Thermoanaerobaculia bacterium]|nr:phosphoenolpyruvate kinase [Thermoanaerobaculia bacterium]